jgi:3-phosphoshikimate 1-carboxyvinyltransferase
MGDLIRLSVPGSKSQTQRALILGALARGETEIEGPLDCDDSQALRAALRALKVTIREEPARWRVSAKELSAPEERLWCGDGGTTVRFLAPLSLLLRQEMVLDGSPRLRERPIDDLMGALRELSVAPRYLEREGSLPVGLRCSGNVGSRATVDVSRSSQFASGLLLVAPLLPEGLTLDVVGDLVSRPYLAMTLHMMRAFGATVREEPGRYLVPPHAYQPTALRVEGDWSSAAFLLAAGFISHRAVEIENVDRASVQGDRVIVELLEVLSRPGPHRFDLTDCPDLIAPLAAASVCADHPVEIEGVSHARLKESDRLAVLAEGLNLAGARVQQRPGALSIEPARYLRPARLDPRGDHRMAMAFGLLSLRQPGIEVLERECVSKSYPGFWPDLERFR